MISVKGGAWQYLPQDIFNMLYNCLTGNDGYVWTPNRHFQALDYGPRGREEL